MSELFPRILLNAILSIVLFAGWVCLDWVYVRLYQRGEGLNLGIELIALVSVPAIILFSNLFFQKTVLLHKRFILAMVFVVVDMVFLVLNIVIFGIPIHFWLGGTI